MAHVAAHGDHAKKKTLRATERDRPDVVESRRRFRLRQFFWRASQLVFIDESGINLALTRSRARAPRGERVHDAVPGGRWQTYTVIAALRCDGIEAPMILPGSMNALALRAWVATTLRPTLRRGDIVVWDNLSVHADAEVRKLIEAAGAQLVFLPPYSPDLNPIEMAWSKVKNLLRTWAARTWPLLVDAVADAMNAIAESDCVGWFRHCGYAVRK